MDNTASEVGNRPPSRCGASSLWKWRGLLIALAVLLAVGAGALAVRHWRAGADLNFACVEAGTLCRSGQPSARQLAEAVRANGIRTIVNLRGADAFAKDARAAEEAQFANAHGIRYVSLPYDEARAQARIAEFLSLVADPANRPVLVHCAKGVERTGVMVAAFRMKVQGWPLPQALAEMEQFGYRREKSPQMQQAVQEFAKELEKAPR